MNPPYYFHPALGLKIYVDLFIIDRGEKAWIYSGAVLCLAHPNTYGMSGEVSSVRYLKLPFRMLKKISGRMEISVHKQDETDNQY